MDRPKLQAELYIGENIPEVVTKKLTSYFKLMNRRADSEVTTEILNFSSKSM